MNWNVHILRLMQINAKLECGEDLSEREIVYVNLLFERVRAVIRPIVEEMERAFGMDMKGIATLVNSPQVTTAIQKRQRRVIAERDHAIEQMSRMRRR